jgi:bifunctional DNase/RNase
VENKVYNIVLKNENIGTTELEKADAAMGVVWGDINFLNISSGYEFFKKYCQDHTIELIMDDSDDRHIVTAAIPDLKVVDQNGIEIQGHARNVEGRDMDFFEITITAISYPFFEEEFPHHVKQYHDELKRKKDTDAAGLKEVAIAGLKQLKKRFLEFGKPENFVLKLELVDAPYTAFAMGIGRSEASELALALEKIQTDRPMPAQLLKSAIELFGYTLSRVVVEKVKDRIYYANMYLVKDDDVKVLDSRAADAITQALRFNCPIYFRSELVEQHELEWQLAFQRK